ncbi:MAG: adenosine kinase [Nitrospirota bacterium]|nr:adenosine kinase [Nitrospirota bacterium]
MSYDVYGIGNAIVDLQVQVEDSFLEAIGVQKGIMTLVEADQQQQILGALTGKPVNRCSGGSACNTVVGVADFGGRGAYACKVGTDEFGSFYLGELRDLGISCEVPADGAQTGTSVILISNDAQRTMLTHLGASTGLSTDDVNRYEITKARYIYVEGYLFASPGTRAAALAAIDMAKEEGVKVALTVSDPFLISMCRDVFWELIRGPVDLLFCNREEAHALTGLEDPVACARLIHEHQANVCLTLGADGSLILHDGAVYPIEGVPVQAVDTTGAGDMYAAGVLYGITNGLTWKQAGHLGSHAAARVVSQLGARMGRKFTPAEIEKLLR